MAGPPLPVLTLQAFQLRSQRYYALHPIEAALHYHRADAEILGEKGHGSCGFEQAEAYYRTGAQGLRLPEIPQLPQKLRKLSRLGPVDRAGRKALREWAEDCGYAKTRDTHLYHRLRGSMGGCLRLSHLEIRYGGPEDRGRRRVVGMGRSSGRARGRRFHP